MKYNGTFADRIRLLRKKYNYTQLELAGKVGIPKSTFAGYENGIRRPKFEVVEKLADVLHTSSDYLIGIADNPQPSKPTKDLRKILESKDYTWEGKTLSDEDLEFVIQLLNKLAKKDVPSNDIESSDELNKLSSHDN